MHLGEYSPHELRGVELEYDKTRQALEPYPLPQTRHILKGAGMEERQMCQRGKGLLQDPA